MPNIFLIRGFLRTARRLRLLSFFNINLWLKKESIIFKLPIRGGIGYDHFFDDEKWMLELLRKLVGLIGETGVFIDVGVNIGQTLIKLKSLNNHWSYIGFEPNPNCLYYLYAFVKANSFKNIRLFPVGLADKTDMVMLEQYNDNPIDSAASIVHGFRSNPVDSISIPVFDGKQIKVPEERISIIKIDVEGAELEVLQGLKTRIENDKPFVICEILPYEESDVMRFERQVKVERLLENINYDTFRIDKMGVLRECKHFGAPNKTQEANYLFVHKSMRHKLSLIASFENEP